MLLPALAMLGQEVLSASRVHARGNRRFLPALGLPVKSDGQIDPLVRYRDGHWEGADSVRAVPRWTMWAVYAEALPGVAVQLPMQVGAGQQGGGASAQGPGKSAGQVQPGAAQLAGKALQPGQSAGKAAVQSAAGPGRALMQAAATVVPQGVPRQLAPVFEFCRGWAGESPKGAADVVCGPLRKAGRSASWGQSAVQAQSAGQEQGAGQAPGAGRTQSVGRELGTDRAQGSSAGWFAAVCKKTRSGLGWKSIAFIVPPEGMDPGRSIYDYTRSVNYLERRIGYNLFPHLPSHLQEIIEEMTATELVCPYSEFDPGLDEGPDREVEYDMELDYLERD